MLDVTSYWSHRQMVTMARLDGMRSFSTPEKSGSKAPQRTSIFSITLLHAL